MKDKVLIYIIRHGETRANVSGFIQGWMNEPLNEAGVSLAEDTGRGMRGVHFDACFSSPLLRASQTARIVLRESGNESAPLTFDDRIKEIGFGTCEGRRITEGGLPPEEARLFFTDPFRFPGFPGGETVQTVCARTQAFLRELAARDDGKTYLVATHGCALRAMLNGLYDNPADYWHGHVPYNCVVSIVEAQGGRMRLIADDRVYYDPKYCIDRYANL